MLGHSTPHRKGPRSTLAEKELRLQFVCPHDKKHCARANQCTWSMIEACTVLNANLIHACSLKRCRAKFGGCKWVCSRDKDR
jgi:hypothetical protein